ncbi:MAG: maleylpyruvate isomerase family mycothiol-dependent enzyme [Actinomycetota bacterium]|nr:maleylpyruvate isomerase family mycothiol-dependent enzyme [Actinomycetota bacterium]
MERTDAIAVINREGERVLELARMSNDALAAPVPTCPGWDLGDLVKHLGNVYNWAGTVVAGCLQAPPGKDIERRPGGMSTPDWMADRLGRLTATLAATPSDALIWNFGPVSPSPVDFWCRRQLHETAIHRVDAELAAGATVTALEPDLAADTVAELLMLARYAEVPPERELATERELAAERAGRTSAGAKEPLPATLHLHAEDVEGAEWTIDTEAKAYARCHARSEVAIRGNAWALARWCWGRPADGELEIFGDPVQADAWRSSLVQ